MSIRIINEYYIRKTNPQNVRRAEKYEYVGRLIDEPKDDCDGVTLCELFISMEYFERYMLQRKDLGKSYLSFNVSNNMEKQRVVVVETGQVFNSIEECSEKLQIPCEEISDAITTGRETYSFHFSKFKIGDYVELNPYIVTEQEGIYPRLGKIIGKGSRREFKIWFPYRIDRIAEYDALDLVEAVGAFVTAIKQKEKSDNDWQPRFKKGDAVWVKAIVTKVENGRFGYDVTTGVESVETFVCDSGDKNIMAFEKP